MKTNNDFIEIKKWQFWDIYPKIVGDDAFPIPIQMNNGTKINYRSHLIPIVHEPKLDPCAANASYITEHDKTPECGQKSVHILRWMIWIPNLV